MHIHRRLGVGVAREAEAEFLGTRFFDDDGNEESAARFLNRGGTNPAAVTYREFFGVRIGRLEV